LGGGLEIAGSFLGGAFPKNYGVFTRKGPDFGEKGRLMVPDAGVVYEFGRFRLDPVERLLLRDEQAVPLTPKAFDLLAYLVEHHGRLAEKHVLLSALWPDAIVEEANLAWNISALRKVLDSAEHGESLIQTVPTRGYRFVAPVTILRRHSSESQRSMGHEQLISPSASAPPADKLSWRRLARHNKVLAASAVGIVAILALAIERGSSLFSHFLYRNTALLPRPL
jgi:DNA-binding winged helix-turn-helix (wHTH) protein